MGSASFTSEVADNLQEYLMTFHGKAVQLVAHRQQVAVPGLLLGYHSPNCSCCNSSWNPRAPPPSFGFCFLSLPQGMGQCRGARKRKLRVSLGLHEHGHVLYWEYGSWITLVWLTGMQPPLAWFPGQFRIWTTLPCSMGFSVFRRQVGNVSVGGPRNELKCLFWAISAEVTPSLDFIET